MTTSVSPIIRSDVIVIGAGISGLCAAKALQEKGVDVRVVEARNRVGGRTFTLEQEEFGWVDLGASYIGRTQNYILRIIRELGIKTYPVYGLQRSIHISNGKRDVYDTQWPQFEWRNATAAQELEDFYNETDIMASEIPLESPWKAAKAIEWDCITYQEFINSRCKTKEAREFLLATCQSNVSTDPCQVSLLWFLWYVKSAGGQKSIWNIIGGGQERKLVGGTSQISTKLATKLKSQIHLDEPVCSINQSEGGKVTVQTVNGTKFEAKYVIMATPLPLWQKIHYNPPLPSLKTQLIQRVTMGTTIKCEIYYKSPFWRKLGFSGMGTCGDGIEIVCNSVDDSKPESMYGQLTCFVTSEQAIKMQSMSKEERSKVVASFVYKLFPNSEEALKPVHYIDKNWTSDQYTGGCYTCSFPPGVLSRYGKTIREPFGGLLFAGTETASEWSGYMNGAVQAGERAAREAMFGLGLIKENEISVKEPEQYWPWNNNNEQIMPSIGEQQPHMVCKL